MNYLKKMNWVFNFTLPKIILTILWLFTVLVSHVAQAQSGNSSLSIHQDDVKMVFQYHAKKTKPKMDVTYYWTKYRKVHKTEGDYSGELLDGPYQDYFKSGQLHSKGKFKNGVKVGHWKSWYDSGVLKESENWVNGKKSGNFQIFHASGRLKETGRYKNGKKHGKVLEYSELGKKKKVRYKNGILIDKEANRLIREEEKEAEKIKRQEKKDQKEVKHKKVRFTPFQTNEEEKAKGKDIEKKKESKARSKSKKDKGVAKDKKNKSEQKGFSSWLKGLNIKKKE